VNNLSIPTSSPSYHSNSRALHCIFGGIRAVAPTGHVNFSVPKTELIHWCTPLQRQPATASGPPPVALNGQLLQPSPKLRWLGYWFVPNLTSSAHFFCRLARSQAPFAALRRHSSIAARVLNCFLATLLLILAAEACLPPLSVLLPNKRRQAALQQVFSPPQIKRATARLCRSFPSLLKFRAQDSHRDFYSHLDPNIMPHNWKLPRPSRHARSNLHVDTLAHLTVPLLDGLSFAPLINSSALPDLPPLPLDNVMKAAHCHKS